MDPLEATIYLGVIPSIICCASLWVLRRLLIFHWGSFDESLVPELRGKTVVITGAGSGIGFETAVALANRGAKVIITGRKKKAAKQSIVRMRNRTFLGTLIPMALELESMDSVKAFCDELKSRVNKIDIIIANAGVLVPVSEKRRTKDGFEIHFGVNHLSHFALISYLFPLVKAASGRIVVVSSLSYRGAVFKPKDVMLDNEEIRDMSLSGNPLYKNSKLANLLFVQELRRQIKESDTHVKVVACCPGIVETKISRNLNFPIFLELVRPLFKAISKKPKQGSETVLMCALSEELEEDAAVLYRHCVPWSPGISTYPDDWFSPTKISDLSSSNAEILWQESERLTGVQFRVQ